MSTPEQQSVPSAVDLLNAVRAHIAVLDGAGVIVLVNDGWTQCRVASVLQGNQLRVGDNYLTACEAAAGPWGEEARAVSVGVRRVLSGQASEFNLDYPCQEPDEQRWFRMTVTPLSLASDRGALVMHTDITERKRAEGALLESERRFRAMVENSWEAISLIDREGRIIYTSPSASRLLGYAVDELEGMNLFAYLHPDDLPTVNAAFSDLVHVPGAVRSAQYRFLHKNGTWLWLEGTGANLFDEPSVRAIVANYRDITRRHAAEAALRESEQRYRLLAEYSTDLISRHTLDGVYLYASPACRALLGYEPEELIGKAVSDFFHNEDWQNLCRTVGNVLEQSAPFTASYRLRHRDGRYVWFETTSTIVRDPATGQPAEIIGVSRDITGRKRAEDLAHQQQMELAHISRLSSMGEMATGLAHELNQPLTAIAHYADACVQTVEGSQAAEAERVLSWARKIADQAERAAQMIRRLRGFIRKTESYRARVELADLVHEAVDLMETDARLHGIRIQSVMEETRPLRVDTIQIEQVMVNLIRNALEAMADNEAERRIITVRGTIAGSMAEVAVEDQGRGIPDEYFGRVFEPFFTSKSEGLGLGLSISRSIIEDHGGQLWVTRNSERGMTFRFRLPLNSGEPTSAS